MDTSKDKRIALLIDADNVSHEFVGGIIAEVSKIGRLTHKKVYGDFSLQNLKPWKEASIKHSLVPVQQFNMPKKNSSDMALAIDAMDILYSEKVDGFCIVSSDSDFTKLASRLREAGMFVMGVGKESTIGALIAAYEDFKFLENLPNLSKSTVKKAQPKKKNNEENPPANKTKEEELIEIIEPIIDKEGLIPLSDLGQILKRIKPEFDCKNYGVSTLTKLVEKLDPFEIEHHSISGSDQQYPHVKRKSKEGSKSKQR